MTDAADSQAAAKRSREVERVKLEQLAPMSIPTALGFLLDAIRDTAKS
jgi:hypothetical protein